MCGIAGILSSRPVAAATLAAMADRLRHRGPDDEGVWIDDSGQVGFGHRWASGWYAQPGEHQMCAGVAASGTRRDEPP